MPLLTSAYPGPPAYQYNGHLQTMIPGLTRRVTGVDYERERLTLSDNDFVDLDWLEGRNQRLLVLTHGLEGDSGKQYMRGTAKLFAQAGYDVLAWNCRSCSGEMNQAFRLYNHGEIGDIDEVIRHALRTKDYTEVVLVGYSMGGNITLKYLGVHGSDLPGPIRRGVAISAPTDLGASAKLLDRPSNRFYRNRFMKKLIVKLGQKANRFPDRLTMTRLGEVRQWRDFDDFFSAPVNGYRDADDFYAQASAVNYMAGIAVPTLLLNAQNDPLLSPECSPAHLAKEHPYLFLETPRTGGHVGFAVNRDAYTYAERRALALRRHVKKWPFRRFAPPKLPANAMTLVYLDAHTLNPGDLNWEPLESLGDVTLHDRTAPDQIVYRARNAELILTNKVKLNRETLAQLPKLQYVGVTATGYDIVDVTAAHERGIIVTNVKGYSTDSVAQLTFALLLELTHHAGRHANSVSTGDWTRSPDFSYALSPLVELAGKTLGLIGYGDIGRKVAVIGQAFGMNVLVNRRHPTSEPDAGIRWVDQDTLFAQSDVVSLHCPATPDTLGLINRERLSCMKPSAYLINTSRGSLLNEPDVADALNDGWLAGAGLDVLSTEPPSADNPLLTARNCLITPHIAWSSYEARQRLMQSVADNVRAFLAGVPQNVVG